MSIESWRDEFLPISAEDIEDQGDAIDHSLLKWEGLRAENLERHGITKNQGSAMIVDQESDEDENSCFMGSGTCALCHIYYQTEPDEGEDSPFDEEQEEYECEGNDEIDRFSCRKCPLAKVRDGVPCDTDTDPDAENGDSGISPWQTWTRTGDAMPMISWLKAAKALDERERQEQVA